MLLTEIEPSLKTEPCRFLLRHWQDLRGDRLLARRADLDPERLAPYLAHIGLFEVRAPDVTICRIAGTAFERSLGFELTGRNVIHLYAPDLHPAAGYRFFMMATQPCAAALELPLRFSSGAQNPHEILLLPVEPKQEGAPTLLLVAMAAAKSVAWQNGAVLPHLNPSPTFRFIDIGAGVPAATIPAKGDGDRIKARARRWPLFAARNSGMR
jgi:hypothetical protein